jgi:hypothetical protein
MGDTPPGGDRRPIARPHAQPRSVARKTGPQRRRGVIIGCCGALLVAAVTAAVLMSRHSSPAPQIAMATPDGDFHIARIIRDSGGKECWQETFNNQTGRVTRSPQPCEATRYDSNGVPVPLGTIHRLDAIGKSFPGH